ncbi:histone H2B-like [Achroia grisella]|uniref:histone H2B-like n=1 Tax=Achroia grisella TaxID=688607 RepID=UPI0027D330DD|nr:histone H2B-like [Achroia grisella]
MVPKKQMKPPKALKPLEKPLEKSISKNKKSKKKNYEGFSVYIYKVMRSMSQDNLRISRKSMLIMNNFVNDMLEKIAVEASRLVAHGKKTTLGSREIQSAVRLLLPGELAKHANIEGMKAVRLYHENQNKE